MKFRAFEKSMLKHHKSLLTAATVVTGAVYAGDLQGATISSTSSYTQTTTIGVGQTLGGDGYWVPDTSSPTPYLAYPNYATSVTSTSDTFYPSHARTNVTVYTAPAASVSLNPSYIYQVPGSGASATLATFTLTGTVPTEFQLGFLMDDNTGSPTYRTNLTISDSAGGSGTVTDSPSATATDFYLIDVTGASAGDVISIVGTQLPTNGTAALIYGMTWDTIIPAPEPTTLGVLGIGALGMLVRRRRRSLC